MQRRGCPTCGSGTHVHQHRRRRVSDPKIEDIEVVRRQCKRCGDTFTVRPPGVTQARATDRTKALAFIWYVLGLSYDAVTVALEAQGMTFSKTAIFGWIQILWQQADDLRRRVRHGRVRFMGLDGTVYKVRGRRVPVQVVTDLLSGQTLEVHFLTEEDKNAMTALMRALRKRYDVKLLTTDDAGVYRAAAEEIGLPQQICIAHMRKALTNRCRELVAQARREKHPRADEIHDRLAQLNSAVKQGRRDVGRLGTGLYRAFRGATPPKTGQEASVHYRLYLMGLKVMEQAHGLFADEPYRKRYGLDGTNNATERAIGLGGKIRYHAMRGFKSRASLRRYLSAVAWLRQQQRAVGPDGFIDLQALFPN